MFGSLGLPWDLARAGRVTCCWPNTEAAGTLGTVAGAFLPGFDLWIPRPAQYSACVSISHHAALSLMLSALTSLHPAQVNTSRLGGPGTSC